MDSFLNNQLEQLDPSKDPLCNRFVETYTAFYGVAFPDVVHHLGIIPTVNYTIATQLFLPSVSIGTVFIVHGYFDHSAMMGHCIRACVEMGFSVIAIDLPGHGLSSGERASIGSFSEYAMVFDECIAYCKSFLPAPFHFVAHSTGCSAGLEWLHTPALLNNALVDKVILLAPLVQSAGSTAARLLFNILKNRVPAMGGPYKATTSDPEFDLFRKNDPLRPKKFPLRWLNAAMEWNKLMHSRGILDKKITVIQGTRDNVVDWKHNIGFLERKTRASEIYYVNGSRHQLHNEREDLREQVINLLKRELMC
jgi:lysophospholipase